MNYYNLIGTLCLLFLTDLCFAQGLVQPTRGHFGIYSHHYLAREFTANTSDEVYTITPLRHQVGLTGEWSLGEHFGLGAHISYKHAKGQRINARGYGFRAFYVPVENRIVDYDYHDGIIDLYSRWYPQERRKPFRSFLQLNFGSHILYRGTTAYPFHTNLANREPSVHRFSLRGGLFMALGGGVQYRLGDNWGMDTSIMFTWPGGISDKPFYFMQYGLQVGVYRVITKKKI
ncbi:MAG: hypothetical protein AB8H47_15660 [Bacteroidia bacterium]